MERGNQRFGRSGYTLIELLVSVAILGFVVIAIARLFNQSTIAWDSGHRRAEVMLTGRAILDLVSRDLSALVDGPGALPVTADSWTILRGTNYTDVAYSWGGGTLQRAIGGGANETAISGLTNAGFTVALDPDGPPYYFADVKFIMESSGKGADPVDKVYTSRVFLPNVKRYLYE